MTTTPQIQTEALTDTSVRITCLLKATPDRVFDAWTKAEQIARWFGPSPAFGCETPEFDCRVGGAYRLRLIAPDGDVYCVFGKYLELDRPNKLAFTWQWEESSFDTGESQVSMEFIPDEDGTRLVIIHDRLASLDSRDQHGNGWIGGLSRLVALFETP
jgi:uncharacterized protein YndB with AHSA1/START domain